MIYLVTEDTKPLDVSLDVDGDITGATIVFTMTPRDPDGVVETGACTIVAIPTQDVRYEWTTDVPAPGLYDAEWEITYSGGEVETTPNQGTELIYVRGADVPGMLVTLQKYQEVTGSTDNPAAQLEAIEDASVAILNYTDRDFGAEEVVETRTFEAPDFGNIVEIDDCHTITDVDGVSSASWRAGSEGPAAAAGVYTYIQFAARSTSPLMGFTRNEDVFGYQGFNDIEVTATFGWPSVPGDVQRACIWTATVYEGDSSNPTGGLAAKSVAEVAENYIQQDAQQAGNADDDVPLPARVRGLLDQYRRRSL